jgi:hypothetical protein
MIETLLVGTTVGIAIALCFFGLFYHFMGQWNGR